MSEAFDRIMQRLKEAEAYLNGQTSGSNTHHIDVPTPDVRAIRASTGLSQADFARSIGVSKGTLLNWEQSRRTIDGPPAPSSRSSPRNPASFVQWMLHP
ncbi:helix-turn-helix domain-containing protein [Paragemmobacter ruber]|uniref:helix-turn-helix domain-containing protein n=1 Tax=Paragemmobacter ruber TaxID=1985673 RepID=UPI001F34C5E7|nr:helix-turn-helix domain-containing protein [Rhodobacter ruber]